MTDFLHTCFSSTLNAHNLLRNVIQIIFLKNGTRVPKREPRFEVDTMIFDSFAIYKFMINPDMSRVVLLYT